MAAPLVAMGVLTGGCAGVAEVTGTASQQDLVQLRGDLSTLQLSVQRTQASVDTLRRQLSGTSGRGREQVSETDRQLGTLARRVEALATTLTAVTARVDELSTRVDTLGRQARGTAPPPQPTVSAPPRPPPPAVAPGPTAPPPAVASRPTTGSLTPRDIYQAAYIDFSKGSYLLAVAGFREFLRRYPDDEQAGAAQYWIGEAHVSMARGHLNSGQPDRATQALEQAVQEFRKVLANYPRSEKAATALYKEALALIEMKQPANAQARLQYLIDNFPQAEEAPLARERLASLKER